MAQTNIVEGRHPSRALIEWFESVGHQRSVRDEWTCHVQCPHSSQTRAWVGSRSARDGM